jgi:hypothetical protein
MRTLCIVCGLTLLAIAISTLQLSATGLPVISTHPRILLTPSIKTQLVARRNANDPNWLRLKAQADLLKTYPVLQFKAATFRERRENTIFYDYQGEGWYSAAMPLAMAFQMTGDVSYSNKLLELVDEMIRAQADPDNLPPNGFGPLEPDNYYATRNLGPVLAIAYDWCYDQLGATRKAAMLALMNAYYNELRDSAYQRNDRADGNYYVGHLFCTAMMGYASHGDNPKAQEMIDWARIRFDGTTSPLIDAEHTPEDFFAQLFDGGARPQVAREYNGPYIRSAPSKGGIHLQGWAYGSATYNWIIDYMLTVKSATGEDLLTAHQSWFSQMLRALKEGLMPNRFEMDPTGDYGGNFGAVIFRSLPVRIAHILAGTPDGPGAQSFAYSEIAKSSPYPVDFPEWAYQEIYQPTPWEGFYFNDTTRPSSELVLPPYYSGFGPIYPQGGATNGAIPFFYMRSDWGTRAKWASLHQGGAWYDDHMHFDAGQMQIKHANDYLLVDAANWKGEAGSIGIVGSSQNSQYNAGAAANTLFFDDYGDYQQSNLNEPLFCGGQGGWGKDEVVAAEQNDNYSYIRSDLSTAYNSGADTTVTEIRGIDYFYRNFAYLRPAGIFVVLDQTKAKASTNPRGPYRKHIRWHFPNRPTVTDATLKIEQGESRLNMAFLLPAPVTVSPVDEMQNPDPCDGTVPGCTPYGFNSGTWRVEVRDPANSLTTPFLTVLQPTFRDDPAMTASSITSDGGTMLGANVLLPGKGRYVMLFNNGSGQTPAPVTSVTYSVAGATAARHTLGGMKPDGRYAVTIADPVVTVAEDAAGTYTASPAGVLQFGTAVSSVEPATTQDHTPLLGANYPNPFSQSTTISFFLPQHQHVTLTLYDALGRAVKTMVDTDLPAGEQSVEVTADGLPNGVYSYTLQGAGFTQTRWCVVMR